MGLFDLPGPAFALVDGAMAFVLPPVARLVLWGLVAGVASMLVYRLISPQARIRQAKAAAIEARRRLNAFDGDFADARPLIKAQLRTAFRHLGLVLPSTLLASLPVLCLLVWLSNTYGYAFPEAGETPVVEVEPIGNVLARWNADGAGTSIEILNRFDGEALTDLPVQAPVPLLEKWNWLNLLFGNPAGYLPESMPIETISIALPERSFIDFGPDWLRSWLTLFLPTLVLSSLAMYRLARIA